MVFYLVKFACLSEDENKVAEVVGVQESVLSRHATGMGRKMVSCCAVSPSLLTGPSPPFFLLFLTPS